jgi:hypothetical protein
MIFSFVVIIFSIKVVLNEMFYYLILFDLWVQTIGCLLANYFSKLFHLVLVRPLRFYKQLLSNATRAKIKRLWFTSARGSKFCHILQLWRLQNYFVLKRSKRNIFKVCLLIKKSVWQRLLCFRIESRCSQKRIEWAQWILVSRAWTEVTPLWKWLLLELGPLTLFFLRWVLILFHLAIACAARDFYEIAIKKTVACAWLVLVHIMRGAWILSGVALYCSSPEFIISLMNIGIRISFLRSAPCTTTVGASSTIAGGGFIRFFIARVLFIRVVLSHWWEEGLRWAVSQFLLVADDLSRKTTKTCLFVCHLILLVAESWDVEVCAEWINSSFWEEMEPACQGCSFIILCMIIWAVDLFTSRTVFALFSLKKLWVILLLFPSMW